MRNSLRTVLAVLSTALALSAQAAWVQWPVNGHYYDVVLIAGGDRSWAAASAQAQAMIAPNGAQGHLATITSAAENAFVFSLADSPAFWVLDIANNNEGPYIGGYQVGGSEPAGGWRWQKGEPWNFTAWAAGEPNNFNGNEHFANLYSPGAGRAATWNDVPSDPSSVVVAYVVEAPWVTGGDLAKDFSSTTNPTQKWRLEKNLGVPFTIRQLDFWSNGGNQIAWADQPFNLNAHVPLWMRLTAIDTPGGSFDAQVGDIVMHGAVNSRTGSVNTSAIFTSNFVGPAIISGHTWLTRQIGRTMEWQIYKNGVFLTKGTLTGNGSTTRANPVLFSSGTGGPAVLNTNLVIGDKVELRYFSTDNLPDVAGVNFTISSLALSNFTIAPSGVVSGNQATGTLTINMPAPPGGAVVSLTPLSAVLSCPATVTIPEGQTGATFQISTTVTSVEIMRQVRAELNGLRMTRNLIVYLPDIITLNASPKTVVGGNNSTGTITANGTAGNGFDVNLSSSGPQVIVPAMVTFNYGARTKDFTITTLPVTSTYVRVITATRNGRTRTVTITVTRP